MNRQGKVIKINLVSTIIVIVWTIIIFNAIFIGKTIYEKNSVNIRKLNASEQTGSNGNESDGTIFEFINNYNNKIAVIKNGEEKRFTINYRAADPDDDECSWGNISNNIQFDIECSRASLAGVESNLNSSVRYCTVTAYENKTGYCQLTAQVTIKGKIYKTSILIRVVDEETPEEVVELSIDVPKNTISIGEEIDLEINYFGLFDSQDIDIEIGDNFDCYSNNEKILSIDRNGKITGISAGTAIICANIWYNGKSYTDELLITVQNQSENNNQRKRIRWNHI